MRHEDLEEDELPPTQSEDEDDDDYYWDEDDQTYEHVRWGVASRADMIAQHKRERQEQEATHKRTSREWHASIDAKLIAARGVGRELPVEVANRIWLDGLGGISFDEAMRLIADGVSQFTLTQILSTHDSVWKRWIEREMPDFWRDLHLSHDQHDPPADWLMASRTRVLVDKNNAHEDDVLFDRVPWRSFYMWLRMFRRQCGKYYGDMFMEYQQLIASDLWRSLDIPFDEEVWRSAIQVTEQDGKTLVSLWLHNEESEQLEPILLTLDAIRSPGKFDGMSDAIPYRLFMLYRKTVARMAFLDPEKPEVFAPLDLTSGGQRPNVGVERGPQHHERYRYNYPPEAVECFVRWYVSVLVAGEKEPVASKTNQEDSPFWDTDLEIVSSHGMYFLRTQHPSLLQANLTRGFMVEAVDDKGKGTGKLYWSWLSMLPLCPRRIDVREMQRTGQRTWVQFLGQHLGGGGGSRGNDDARVGYMISHDDTDYMGTALIGTSHAKWLKMAHESSIKGHHETGRQRRYFFAMAGRSGGRRK
jgi:hypothetical protein